MPEVSKLMVKIGADTGELESKLKQSSASVNSFAASASKLGGGLADIGKVAAGVFGGNLITGAVSKLAEGFTSVVKTSTEFSHGMSAVGAATGTAGAELDQLRGLALDLGKDVQLAGVDATDAATAIAELGRGGVSAGDLLGGAAKGGLLLFSAGADSVEQASQVAITAMANFGLTGAQIPHVADVIGAAAGKSATSVGKLGDAFNQSAAVASGAGISFEELSGTLAFLAQRGVQGSDAGTALKTTLQRLQAPTDEAAAVMAQLGINVRDANGNMLPLAGIADVLKEHLGGLSSAQRDAALQTLGGADAIRVLLPLIAGGGDAVREWTAKVDDAGYASRIGAQLNDDLAGSFSQLQATIQTAAITVGTRLEPSLRKATDAGTKFITDFVNNPAVQRGIDQFATNFAKGLDQVIAKLGDPTFQNQMKEWAIALRDTATAVVSLAGTVKDVLGPPILAAVGWFNSLDESGKKNVVTFGLLAVAIAKLAGPLGTIASAGGTAAKVLAGIWGAIPAGAIATTTTAIAAGTAITVAATAAWVGITAGMVKYRDATGGTAKMQSELVTQLSAAAFAQEHGATATNGAIDGFARYLDMTRTVITSQDQLAQSWNAYINSASRGGQSTQALTLALTAQQQAQLAVNRVLGEGLLGQIAYNDGINIQAGAARALAGTITAGLATQQAAVDAQARYALALQDTNGAFTPYQAAQAAVNLQVAQASLNLQLAEARTAAIGQAMAIAEVDTGEFGTTIGLLRDKLLNLTLSYNESGQAVNQFSGENQRLGGFLQVLQGQWDTLNTATENGKHVTADQKAEYEKLAPAIQYLNGVMGENQKGVVDNVLKLVGLEGQLKNTGVSYSTAAAAVSGQFGNALAQANTETTAARVGLAAAEGAAKAFGGAASASAGGANTQATATRAAGAAAATAAGQVSGLGAAIAFLPKSFTITAHVDISQALANIQQLSNNIPRSPAKEGPFSGKLPTWMAIYDQLAPAGDWAVATVGKTTGAMSAALKAGTDEAAKTAADIASAVAKAIGDVLGASKALAGVNPTSGPTGAQFSWLTAMTTAMVASMQDAAAGFKSDGLKAASELADAASKIGGSIKNTIDGLAALASAKWAEISPDGNALGWLMHLTVSLVASYERAAAQFSDEGLKAASSLSDAASKIGGGIKATIDGLAAIASAKWADISPSGNALGWMVHLAASLTKSYADAAATLSTEGMAAGAALGEAAGKIGGSIKGVLEGLAALAAAKWADISPSGSSLGWLTHVISSLVASYQQAAAQFKSEGLAAAASLGESVTKVAGSIGPVLAGLKDIAGGVPIPTSGQLDQFFAGVRAVFGRFAEMAKTLDGEATEQVGKFATSANSVMGAAKSSIDLFRAFAPDKDGKNALVIPGIQAINEVSEGIKAFVAKFAEMATMLTGEGLAKVSAFAGGVSAIVGAAKGSLDLFKSMNTEKVPAKEIIDYVLGSMGYVVSQTQAIAAGIGSAGVAAAAAFATGTLNVFTTIKTTLESFAKLTDYKDIPAQTVKSLFDSMEGALQNAADLTGRADAFLVEALDYKGKMLAAEAAYAVGMAVSLRNGGSTPLDFSGAIGGGTLAIPALASGGIVTKPTLALIGEGREPEAVVPLSQYNRGGYGGGGGGGSVTVVVQGNVYGVDQMQQVVADAVTRARPAQRADMARALKPELDRVITAGY